MSDITITDVRVVPGDSGFLVDDGENAFLYDTGFAFTGFKLAENIKRVLGKRELDYIFLTHSHYDHAAGAAYVSKVYPEAKIVATEYAQKIFQKSTAKAVMRELDRKHAMRYGLTEYEDLLDTLHADITVSDGDIISCGNMSIETLMLPGHTRCSAGFYLAEHKMLLSSETLGVYFGKNTILPACLTGYEQTLKSFQKAKMLDVQKILIPHYGVISNSTAKEFLILSEKMTVKTAETIMQIVKNGGSAQDAANHLYKTLYTEEVRPAYPEDAFKLNTEIMVSLISKEMDKPPEQF